MIGYINEFGYAIKLVVINYRDSRFSNDYSSVIHFQNAGHIKTNCHSFQRLGQSVNVMHIYCINIYVLHKYLDTYIYIYIHLSKRYRSKKETLSRKERNQWTPFVTNLKGDKINNKEKRRIFQRGGKCY